MSNLDSISPRIRVKIKSWKPPPSLVKLPCRLKPPGCFIQPNSLEKTTGNGPPGRQALLSLRSPELGFQFSSTKATSVTLGLWKFIYQKLTHHKFRAQSKKNWPDKKHRRSVWRLPWGYPLEGIILQFKSFNIEVWHILGFTMAPTGSTFAPTTEVTASYLYSASHWSSPLWQHVDLLESRWREHPTWKKTHTNILLPKHHWPVCRPAANSSSSKFSRRLWWKVASRKPFLTHLLIQLFSKGRGSKVSSRLLVDINVATKIFLRFWTLDEAKALKPKRWKIRSKRGFPRSFRSCLWIYSYFCSALVPSTKLTLRWLEYPPHLLIGNTSSFRVHFPAMLDYRSTSPGHHHPRLIRLRRLEGAFGFRIALRIASKDGGILGGNEHLQENMGKRNPGWVVGCCLFIKGSLGWETSDIRTTSQ